MQVAAEGLAEISLKYKIVAVPTVLFVKVGNGELGRAKVSYKKTVWGSNEQNIYC